MLKNTSSSKCRHRLWWYDSDAISNIVVVPLLHKLRYAREIGYINKQREKVDTAKNMSSGGGGWLLTVMLC